MGLSAFLSTQVIDTTSVGRSVMTAADAAAARAAIGAGTSSFDGAFSSLSGKPTTLSGYGITDAQPLDSDLTAIAALTTTTYGRSLLTGADAAATRTTLGLGTLATQSGTFSGTSSGTNTGDQTITLTGDVTGSGTGSFVTTIANSAVTNAMLAGSIAISKLAITGTPDGTKFLRDDGTWAAASGGSGLTSLNGLTGSTQTFAVGTSGTDFAISSTGTAHTFNIPDASASARGLVTTGTQTFAGNKSFSGSLSLSFAGTALSLSSTSGAIDIASRILIDVNQVSMRSNAALQWSNSTTSVASAAIDLTLNRDAGDTLALRRSTNGQTFNISNTYTSSTSFEYGRFQWNTNEFRIGTAVGSAGGTQRDTVLGAWNSAGTWRAVATVAANSGSPVFNITPLWMPGLTFTSPTIGSLTASTEFSDVNFNLTATRTWSAGALTTQRAFRIQAPTYAFASASTITTASTLSISGAPTAGTNATITNAYALNVESGSSNFQRIFVTDGTNSFESSSWAGAGLVVRSSGNQVVGLGPGGIRLTAGAQISFCSDAAINTPEIGLIRDAANALAQRNSTNAQTFRVYNTFTSATNAEWLQQSWVSNEARIGTAVGSAGGTQRSTVLGLWNSAGSWTAAVTIATTGVVTFGNTINISSFSGMVMGSDVTFARDTARTLELRSSTSAITFALSNTYTSGTNFEQGKFQWVTNEWRIGTAVGSSGGIQRTTAFGLWDSAGTWAASFSVDSSANLNITDSRSLVLGTTTGTKIGTATSQKIGFWNATPIVQPTTGVASATRTGGGGTTLTDTDTYDGYTIAQVVKALRNLGVLA